MGVVSRLVVSGLAAVVVLGCASYKRDMENACHAVERSKVRELPIKEEDVLTVAASWAAERARTPEGQRIWNTVGNVTPLSKAEVFRDAAKEAGIVDCPFADEVHAAVLADELERQQRLQKLMQKSSPSDERESTNANGPL